MLLRVILDNESHPEVIDGDSLYTYNGPKDLSLMKSVEATVNTQDGSLSVLADIFPRLEKLRLTNSKLASVRDIGCHLANLRSLSLANCGITSLSGIFTISHNVEELHLAFNAIKDLSDLMGLDKLRVLDLEGNQITDIAHIGFLASCQNLTSLTLSGNPAIQNLRGYCRVISEFLPNLIYLDERRINGRKKVVVRREEKEKTVAPPGQEPKLHRPRRKHSMENASEGVVTELIADKVDGRPPSARGQVLKAAVRVSAANPSGERAVIQIVRPRSARDKFGGK
jgi:hypothetical protein